MCHTRRVTTAHLDRNGHATFTSPVAAGVRLIAETSLKRGPKMRNGVRRAVAAIREALLIVLGFTALTVGAFEAHPIAGWTVGGLSLLVMDYCRRADRPDTTGDGHG